MHKISGHKKVINKEEKLSQKLSTAKMHLKRGKIKLYTKLSTLSTFFIPKRVFVLCRNHKVCNKMKNCGKHIDISNMKKDENIKENV